MHAETIVGAVLAGGEGRRIGGRKAMADLAGAPLIVHAARILRSTAAVAVVGDAEAAAVINATALRDPAGAARGPLAGVLAALEWANERRADWVIVIPCDAPLLPSDLPDRLRAAAGERVAACVETPVGLEPLVAIWRTDALSALREALRDGAHPSARAVLADLGAGRLALGAVEEAMNVNTLEDLKRATAWLSRG